jgi:hypothetical protein
LLQKKRPDLAVEVFQLLVSLFPDHPYGHVHLGDAYAEVGDEHRAQASRLRALAIDTKVAAAVGL